MHVLNKPASAPCTAQFTAPRQACARPSKGANWAAMEPCKALRPFATDAPATRLRWAALQPFRAAAAAKSAPPAEEVDVREEQAGPCRLRLHVTVPASQVASVYKQTINEYRKGITVAGFRKGKAPDASVVAEVGGQTRFNNTVMATLLETTMKQALAPYNATIIEDSDNVDQDGATLAKRFDTKSPFEFSVSFDIMPQLKWKQPYRDVKVEVEAAGDADSDAAAVDAKLEGLRKEGAQMRVVADRGMQVGDIVIVDIDFRAPGGDSLVGGVREGFRLDTSDSDASFIPGVAGVMLGLRVGESRVAPLAIPDHPDLQPATLRGKQTEVHVTLKELFEPDLPEMTDAWAEGLSPGCGGLAGLRAQLLEGQKAETDAKTAKAVEDALLGAVADAVDCPVPESLVNRLGQQEYQVKLQEMLQSGQLSYEVVQQLATEQLLSDYVKNRRAELEHTQRGLMAIDAILKAEKLTATLPEIQEEFKKAVEGFEQYNQEYDRERLMEQVQQQIEGRKAMDWMLANLGVTVLPYSGKK